MFSIGEELELFQKKSINTYEIPLNDLYDPLSVVESKINNIDKVSKKSAMTIELLNEELVEKKTEINSLKKELNHKEDEELKFAKKVSLVLDQIDGINRYAQNAQNEALINNLNNLIKIIKKELIEVEFEEIPAVGEIFNPKLHECIEAVADKTKSRYEIIDVIKRGYKYKGQVIRTASVIAVK